MITFVLGATIIVSIAGVIYGCALIVKGLAGLVLYAAAGPPNADAYIRKSYGKDFLKKFRSQEKERKRNET